MMYILQINQIKFAIVRKFTYLKTDHYKNNIVF